MTVWPGDEIGGYRVERLVAYQGKENCKSAYCRRRFAPGDPPEGICCGWHCSLCDEPCGSMGHQCPETVALRESR